MWFTREADYALRIVSELAYRKCKMDAKLIAYLTGVTVSFTLKILRKLVKAGIVRSYKGISGGYIMDKAPQEISVRQVVEIIDGPVAINRCIKAGEDCSRVSDKNCCPIHLALWKINDRILEQLDEVHISDIVADYVPGREPEQAAAVLALDQEESLSYPISPGTNG